MTASIRFEIDQNHIGFLTLNRPQARNALDWSMMEGFAETVSRVAARGDLMALILTGEGGAFCAGGDLFELHNFTTHADGKRLARLMGDALVMLAELSHPVIAAIEGPAIGGGAEIALACDMRVASESATIGFPQIQLALTPAWGGVGRLIQLLGYPSTYSLLSSGEVLDGQRAFSIGLTQHLVPEGQALQKAAQIAQELTSLDPRTIRSLKKIMRAYGALSKPQATTLERSLFAELWAAESHVAKSSQFVKRKGSS
jgi:enoyl-CoA hydratase/carnithine racemase